MIHYGIIWNYINQCQTGLLAPLALTPCASAKVVAAAFAASLSSRWSHGTSFKANLAVAQ